METERTVVVEAAPKVPNRTLSVRSRGVPQVSVIVPLSLNVVAMKVPATLGMLRIQNFQQTRPAGGSSPVERRTFPSHTILKTEFVINYRDKSGSDYV